MIAMRLFSRDKIGGVMLGLSPVETVLIASVITVIYSSMGGLKGVIITDFFIYFGHGSDLLGSYYLIDLPQIGSLDTLLTYPNVVNKLNFIPSLDQRELVITLFVFTP